MKDSNNDIKNGISSNEGGILALLLRTYIADSGYSPYLNVLIERAVEKDTKNATGGDVSNITKTTRKGQYSQNLASGSITWKVFINLLSRIFGVSKFRLTIEVEHADETVSAHTVSVDMSKIVTKYDMKQIEDITEKGDKNKEHKEEKDDSSDAKGNT